MLKQSTDQVLNSSREKHKYKHPPTLFPLVYMFDFLFASRFILLLLLYFSLSFNSILTLLPFPLTEGPPSFFPFSSLCPGFLMLFYVPLLLHSSPNPLLIRLIWSIQHTLYAAISYLLIFTSAIMHQQVLIPSSPLRFPLKGFIYKGSYWIWFSMVNMAQLYHSHINLERASCWKIKVKRKQLLHPQWVQVPGHMSWSERIRVDIRKMEGNKTPKPNRSIKG